MNVLIIGSAPNAIEARSLDLSFFNKIVSINNAWKITPFWTDSIFPDIQSTPRIIFLYAL